MNIFFQKYESLDDYEAERVEGGTVYCHKEYAVEAFIPDDTPGIDDPKVLLAEIKKAIMQPKEGAK